MGGLDGEQALRLLEALVVPTITVDHEGRVDWLNPGAERLLGWPRRLLEGEPIATIVPPRIRSVGGIPFHRFISERGHLTAERPLRVPVLRRDGVEIETECSISAMERDVLVLSLQRRAESFGVDALDEERGSAAEGPAAAPEQAIENEQRYRLLFDHAPLGIWHFDDRGVITACNDQFVHVMGSSKRVLVGLNQLTLRDSFVVECVRGALAGERTHYEGDYRSATAGKVTPVRADFAPIRAEDGTVIGGVGILEDITERKRAEEALRESNAALRALFEASPVAIVAFGVDRRVRMWNLAAERFFGFSEQEVLGQPFPCVPPQREDEFRMRFDGVIAGETLVGFETYYLRRDQSPVDVSVSAAPLSRGVGPAAGVMAVVADITESKRALVERAQLLQQEQAARRVAQEAQRRLEMLAQASAEIAGSLDYDDTLQRAARMALPRFAQHCIVYLDEDGSIRRIAAAHLQADHMAQDRAAPLDVSPFVHEVIRSGRSRFADAPPPADPATADGRGLICVPLVVLGRVLGALSFARDASAEPFASEDVPLAEEIGRRAGVAIDNARLFHRTEQALRSREEFLSVASHELRTPITSLGLSAQNLEIMAAEGTLASASSTVIARALSTVVRQSRHLSHLIDQLLDLSRIQAGRFEVTLSDGIDLVKTVRMSATRLDRQLAIARCALGIEAPPNAVLGCWDASRIDQVVSNLLTNAMKFGAGKPIEVTVAESEQWAMLVVTDHGVGIAPEQQSRIFDRFERGGVSSRHYGGLGLGLYIARQIVEAHRGTISVASELGQGTTFTVKLPKRPAVVGSR